MSIISEKILEKKKRCAKMCENTATPRRLNMETLAMRGAAGAGAATPAPLPEDPAARPREVAGGAVYRKRSPSESKSS